MSEKDHFSSVEAAAMQRETQMQRAVLQHDQKKARQGFEMGRPDADGKIRVSTVGMSGQRFEEWCLRSTTESKIQHVHARDLPEIPDDNDVVTAALEHSYFAKDGARGAIYPSRHLYMPEWLGDVYNAVCSELRLRKTFLEAEKRGVLIEDIVKPVPCLQTQMDKHRGIDCFFVIHDPDAYQASKKAKFPEAGPQAPVNPDVREARYWNAETDTVVTMDITGYLGAKFGYANRDHTDLRADIFASKTQSATNHYLRQHLQKTGADPLPDREEKHGGKFYFDRMRVLAERIVDAFEVKSGRRGGERLRHIRNPEAEQRERIESQQAVSRDQAAKTLVRNKEKKERDEKNKVRGEQARQEHDARGEVNLDQLPPHERRIYLLRQQAKQDLIERAKNEGKKKKKGND